MNPKVNLLPWRARRKQQKRRRLLATALLGLVVVLGLCFAGDYCLSQRLAKQTKANAHLRQAVVRLNLKSAKLRDLKTQNDRLIHDILFFQNLQTNRLLLVHLFDELIKLKPPELYLKRLSGSHNTITLEGLTKSNRSLSQLMANITHNPWMKSARLLEVKKEKTLSLDHFLLEFLLRRMGQ
jgi:type IV pilus assembly protein PilN